MHLLQEALLPGHQDQVTSTAFLASSSRSSDSVNVLRRAGRYTDLNDSSDVGVIDTTSRHIRSDQYRCLSVSPEALRGSRSLPLVQPRVNLVYRHAFWEVGIKFTEKSGVEHGEFGRREEENGFRAGVRELIMGE